MSALVIVGRLVRALEIELLIDTGADRSIIHPTDAGGLGIDLGRDFSSPVVIGGGIGGPSAEYLETCDIYLQHEAGDWDHFVHNIGFSVPTAWNLGFPSILGRDILRHYRLTFEEISGLVTLETPSAV